MEQVYFIYAIIPKNITLQKRAFIHCGGLKKSRFISDYNYAITNNKVFGRFKFVHDNGGLDEFFITKMSSVKCCKEEISAYKSFYQDVLDNYVELALKLEEEYK